MTDRDQLSQTALSSRTNSSAILSRAEASVTHFRQPNSNVSHTEQLASSAPVTSASMLSKFLPRKFTKKTSGPIIATFILLFGVGGFISITFAPGIPLMQMVETLTTDLNSQLAGIDRTNTQLMRAKLSQTTAGSCGTVKIACRFKSINMEKATEAYKQSGITLEFDERGGFGSKRGRITKMTYVNPFDPNDTLTVNSAGEYADAMKDNSSFRTAAINAKNPLLHSLKNGAAMRYLGKIKTSYAKKLSGKTKKELDSEVEKASSGKVPLKVPRVVAEKDESGKETGNFVDEDGKIYTADEAAKLTETEQRITGAPKASSIVDDMAKGAMVTGIADTACTVYNTSRAVSFAAKTIMAAELARYAMIWHNTGSAMLADDVEPEQVEYVGNKLTHTDTRKQVVDESKLDSTPQGQPLPMIENPNYGKSGLDATFYKQSAYQDRAKIDFSTQRFVIGGGLVGRLSGVNQAIARAVGADSPKELTQRCRIVQNPVVRGGSLVVGVLAGVGSFGATTAFSIAGSVALGMALPYLVAQLGDIVAGRVTGPDLTGVDMMNATAVGTSVMLNGIAREQGMIPMPADKMTDYQNENRQVQIAYATDERVAAQRTPFDIKNQYSFLGSLARSVLPINTTIRTKDAAGALAILPKIFSLSATAFTPNSSAFVSRTVKQERYERCPDETYQEMNIAADPSCSVPVGLPKEAMEADPVEVAEWMAANNEIDPESETGEAKDNDAEWNYKKFLNDCIDQQPGAHEDPEESPDNGYACVDPANHEKNWRYAKYTVSKNWNEVLDGDIPGLYGGGKTGFGSGATGEVNAEGWAYPTTSEAITTSPFGPRGGAPHNGVDLAQPGGALDKPIFAARDGEVIAAGPADGFGQWIVLRHEVDGKRVDTVYGHMYPDGVFVKQGETVTAGQEIAKIGNNGQSTGPHLHFEIWDNGHSSLGGTGRPIDPAEIIESAKGGGAEGGS